MWPTFQTFYWTLSPSAACRNAALTATIAHAKYRKPPDYWIYPVPQQQLWNWQWQEWWDSLYPPRCKPSHPEKLSTIPSTAFRCNLEHLASQNRPYWPVGTTYARQRVPRSLIARKKDVPVDPLHHVQDISASVMSAPDSEPHQLTCKTLKSRRKSDTLR